MAALICCCFAQGFYERASAQNPFASLATRNAWAGIVTRAKSAHDHKDNATAEKLLLEALALVKNNDETLYLNTLEILAAQADVTRDFEKNLRYRKILVDYYVGVENPPEQLIAYKYKLGIAYHKVNLEDKAFEYLAPATQEMESKFSEDNPFLADLYIGMAIALLNVHRQKEAEIYMSKAKEIRTKFMLNLEPIVKAVWNPPRLDHSVKAVVSYKLRADGKFTNATIKESSGDSDFDKSCLHVINGITYPITTWKYYRDGMPLKSEYSFSYNAWNDSAAQN